MTDTNQLPPLPTLRPGDSHMESLIEAAIQGHADTREAMRWLVRQLVPATQPAEVTDAEIDALCLSLTGFMTRKERDRAVARAILALRPVAVPMTDEQVRKLFSEKHWYELGEYPFTWGAAQVIIRAAEAHHGITAQAKKEGSNG